jgi:calcineurin-like phosphoesterase family protein
MIWFTADTHFNHSNIIKYCNRPFDDTRSMNEYIINNINNRVKADDTFYILGDFCFCRDNGEYAKYLLDLIKCKNIFLIKGNHDSRNILHLFKNHYDIFELNIEKKKIVLFHYPIVSWNAKFHKSWHLYGHCHGTLKEDEKALSFDVGVDAWDFCPVSFEQVKEKMLNKERNFI